MKPTKILLEKTSTHFLLKSFIPGTLKGYTVIDSTPINTGKSLDGLRKNAAKYAKRFSIPFEDRS